MTKLFNKGGDGAGEIVRVLGLIDNDLDLPSGNLSYRWVFGIYRLSSERNP